jgi:cytochrome c oxidase subunit 7c
MLARATFRAASAPTLVARRGFQSTRAQMASPYHYPEGPRSNLPFDPLKRGFAFKYWGFMGERIDCNWLHGHKLTRIATGFSLPFLLAGETTPDPSRFLAQHILTTVALQSGKQRRTNRCIQVLCMTTGERGTCRIRRGPAKLVETQHQFHNCLVFHGCSMFHFYAMPRDVLTSFLWNIGHSTSSETYTRHGRLKSIS